MQNNYVPENIASKQDRNLPIKALSVLFNLLPYPALIYDKKNHLILDLNLKLSQLTGLSKSDLINKGLSSVFGQTIEPDLPTDSADAMLNGLNNNTLEVHIAVYPIDEEGQQVVLLIEQNLYDENIKDYLISQELLFDTVREISSIGYQPDTKSTLSYTRDIIKSITHTDQIAFYFWNQNSEEFTQSSELDLISNITFLPEKVPIAELPINLSITIWKENKKPSHILEDKAAEAGRKFFITLPITKIEKKLGLVCITGEEPIPTDENMRFLYLVSLQVFKSLSSFTVIESAKNTIQKLKHVLHLNHIIMDNLDEGVIILTPDLKIAEMNPAAEIILGYTSNEVFRHHVDTILIGNETLSSAFSSFKRGIPAFISNDLQLHNRNGKAFPAQIYSLPVKETDKIISIIILLRDMSQTEKIRIRTQQLEQRAYLGEVSAVFAHEVKNPINSLMTGLQYIGMNLEDDSPHKGLIERLQNDCQRLTHLMDSVLTFSKPLEYHFDQVDLEVLITNILERWKPRMRRLNIEPHFDNMAKNSYVLGDQRALEQVFVNLISNAVQAMESKGGSLSIKIEQNPKKKSDSELDIIFADSGPGIPDEILDHIFEPFITTNPNGTGLGLAISKRIISAHKGIIYVESYPGGSMFHVLLPIATGESK